MATRHQNHGLRKVCGCARRGWAKCPHSWYVNFKPPGGVSHRFSVDKQTGKRIEGKTEAETLAEGWRAEIRAGTFRQPGDLPPPAPPAPAAVTLETFCTKYAERVGKPLTEADAACLEKLRAFQQLGAKSIQAITEDDLEAFFADLVASGRTLPISARRAAVLEMAKTDPKGQEYGPTAYVFGELGLLTKTSKRAWQTAVVKAAGHAPVWTKQNALDAASLAVFRAQNLTFHDLRHEAGSRLLEAGWPAHHVQHMLGHANLSQTSTYLNATKIGLQESMRRLDAASGCNPVANPEAIEQPPNGNGIEPQPGTCW